MTRKSKQFRAQSGYDWQDKRALWFEDVEAVVYSPQLIREGTL